MTKQQVKAIIKLLKSKELDLRPVLQRVFEQGGSLWATDGYICYEIAEIQDELKGKSITLDELKAWNATHTKATDILGNELFTEREDIMPDMKTITSGNFKDAENIKVDIDKLKLACELLGCKSISLEVNEKNGNLYRIKPLKEDEINILVRAMGSKAYVMGLKN